MQFQIGIIADWLGLPLDKALAKCAALGADGVQLYAVGGEMAPDNMTPASLQEKRALLKDNGLTVSALCGDLGGHGFAGRRRIQPKSRNPSGLWIWPWSWAPRW